MTTALGQQLAEIIVAIRNTVDRQPDYDKYNEARTREAVVAPILSTIGWNVADFALVDVEYPVNSGQGQRRIVFGQIKNGRGRAGGVWNGHPWWKSAS